MRGDGGVRLFHRRQRTAERVVGDQHAPRIDPHGRQPRRLTRRFDDAAAQQLAEGSHGVACPGRGIFQRADRVQQVAQLGNVGSDPLAQGRGLGRCQPRHRLVTLLELVETGGDRRFVSDGCRGREVEEPIGDSRQRRHHHHRARTAVRGGDVTDETPDRFRIRHRGAAEFQDHRTRTHYSSTAIS